MAASISRGARYPISPDRLPDSRSQVPEMLPEGVLVN